MNFKQTDINLTRYKYIIEANGVSVIKKKLFSANEQFVPFENIGSEIKRVKERKLVWLILSVLFLILTLLVFVRRINGAKIGDGAEVFWLSISLGLFIFYAFKRKNSLFLVKDNMKTSIEFLGIKWYEKRVHQFIKELLKQRDDYLNKKYPLFEGLSTDENMFCVNAEIQLSDGLFLKKQTKHPLEKLVFDCGHSANEKQQGICSTTTEKNARRIIKEYQDKLITEGKYIFISGFSDNRYQVGLVTNTSDPYKVMEYAGTNGINYDVETTDIIAKCKLWDFEFGITLTSIGFDFCECEIANRDIDYKKLAVEVYEFCPDTVEQGMETIELLEIEIREAGRIFLWWD